MSESNRMDTRSLVTAFCLPRVRMYSSTMWGTTSMAGRARSNHSSSSSGASGSSAMPLLISQLLTDTEPWSGSCESTRITMTDGCCKQSLDYLRSSRRSHRYARVAIGRDSKSQVTPQCGGLVLAAEQPALL